MDCIIETLPKKSNACKVKYYTPKKVPSTEAEANIMIEIKSC